MSAPGWYPDPGGAHGRFRYWDGSTWSAETTPNPGGPTGGAPKKRPIGLIIGIIAGIVAVALVAIFVVPRLFNPDEPVEPVNTSSPTESPWDETTKPTTKTPSNPQSSGGTHVACPKGDPFARQSSDQADRIVGGGLSANKISGWKTDTLSLSFAYDVQSQSFTVVSAAWFNNIAVGALRMADGFEEPKQSAGMVMQCLASSGYYPSLTSRKDIVSSAVTIDGLPGWHLRSEFRVSERGVAGDVVDVIVIDPQKGEGLALFQSSATIGRQDIQRLVDASAASLRVT